MCKGKKKCKQCSAIKIGNTMARRKSRRSSVTFKKEDIVMAAVGAAGSLFANRVIHQVIASQPDNKTKDILKKAIPGLKLAAGGYLATAKGQKRNMRFLGVGIAATGAIELGNQFAPEYFGIGDSGNLYQQIGATDPMLRLQVDPGEDFTDTRELSLSGSYASQELSVS